MNQDADYNEIKPKAGVIHLEQPGVLEKEFERLRAIKGLEDLTDQECMEAVYAIRTLAIVFYHALVRANKLKINLFGIDIEGREDQNQQVKQAA